MLVLVSSCDRNSDKRPDVIIVLVDALRADHLDIYGHDLHTSPYLSSQAAKGVVFENAVSQARGRAPAWRAFSRQLFEPTRFDRFPMKNVEIKASHTLTPHAFTIAEAFKARDTNRRDKL